MAYFEYSMKFDNSERIYTTAIDILAPTLFNTLVSLLTDHHHEEFVYKLSYNSRHVLKIRNIVPSHLTRSFYTSIKVKKCE